ncbi:MAG: radical SAM family heme chaperone HemW [Pyrinomonadaceae bacterium]
MAAGIYIHIPFCKSRCSYCDFATDVYRDSGAVERYVAALCEEIRVRTACVSGRNELAPEDGLCQSGAPPAHAGGSDFDTIYFGGGTPSLLAPKQVERILDAVRSTCDISPDAEITMEMNPATVTPESLARFRELGINRASFGVQTFNDRALKLLARGHDANDARNTFRMLREAGFENVSFDLIAGLPGQRMDDWTTNLDEAIMMSPEHLSLYLLEIHESTPLAEQIRSGRQPTPDPELAAEMYELMLDRLAAAGYQQYEISNFSKPGFESRHNTKYWRLDPVYGFGVSAHSFDGRQRYANERDTAKYVEMIENSGSSEVLREDIDLASEHVFLGLRLSEGIDLETYRKTFDQDLLVEHAEGVARLESAGLVDTDSEKMRLTGKGKLFSNEVFSEFV